MRSSLPQRWLFATLLAGCSADPPAHTGRGPLAPEPRVVPAVAVVLGACGRDGGGPGPAPVDDGAWTDASTCRARGPLLDVRAPSEPRRMAVTQGGGLDDAQRPRIGAGPSQPPRYDVTHAAFAERW